MLFVESRMLRTGMKIRGHFTLSCTTLQKAMYTKLITMVDDYLAVLGAAVQLCPSLTFISIWFNYACQIS